MNRDAMNLKPVKPPCSGLNFRLKYSLYSEISLLFGLGIFLNIFSN